MPRKPHPKTAEIEKLAREGKTLSEISKELDVAYLTVYRILDKSGFEPAKTWRKREEP